MGDDPVETAEDAEDAEDTKGTRDTQNVREGAPTGRRSVVSTLWVLGISIMTMGAIYATWPLWGPELVAKVTGSEAPSAAGDPGVAGVRERPAVLEPLSTPRRGSDAGLQALEEQRSKLSRRIKALVDTVGKLELTLATLMERAETVPSPNEATDSSALIKNISDRLALLEKDQESVASLMERITRVEQASTGSGVADETLTEISGRVEVLEAERAETSTRQAAILAVGNLRRVLATSAPFPLELQALNAVAGSYPKMASDIAVLELFAPAGVPTLASLRRQFEPMAVRIASAATTVDGDGWIARAVNRAKSLVTVRRMSAGQAPDGVDAILLAAETSVAAGDLGAAIDALKSLKGPSSSSAATWLVDARVRLEAEQAMARLHVQAVSLLTSAKE